jgi:hypothetical protein
VTFAHIIYIPMLLAVGIVLGLALGARAARNAMDLERRRDEERVKARAEREARKAARAAADGSAPAAPTATPTTPATPPTPATPATPATPPTKAASRKTPGAGE